MPKSVYKCMYRVIQNLRPLREKVRDDLELIWPEWLKIQLIWILFTEVGVLECIFLFTVAILVKNVGSEIWQYGAVWTIIIRSYLHWLAAMVSLPVDLLSTENCLSWSILILELKQDIFLIWTRFFCEFALFWQVFRVIYIKNVKIQFFWFCLSWT